MEMAETRVDEPKPALLAQYRRAFVFVAPHWRGLLLVLTLSLFSTLVGLAQPYISRLLIDNALLRRDFHALLVIAGLMVLVSVLSFVLGILSSYRYVRISAQSLFEMRLAVYQHLQRMSPSFFHRTRVGDLVSRINNDISEVQRICSDTLLSVFTNLLFLVGSVAIMLWLNWRLFFLSVILLPLGVASLRYYQGRLAAQTKTLRERSSEIGSFLIETLFGMRLTIASGNEAHEANKFRGLNDRFVDSLLSMQVLSFLASGLPTSVLTLSTAVVFLYGGKLVIDGQLSVGALVAFMAYHARLLSPVQSLLGIYTSLITGGVALKRVFDLLDAPVEVAERPDSMPLPHIQGDIEFRNVSFSYTPEAPVIEGVSFTIPAGSFYALVGHSGAGKSTLADLLLRFHDPRSGAIYVDGHNLRDISFADLRQHIALVEQTPYFFRASIRENIAYGRPGATMPDIRAACVAAYIDDVIQALPSGYDTVLAERGSTLSVGERQRVALARALLRSPRILILDEPSSALDDASERALKHALRHTLRSCTTLLITHRMSMAQDADRVLTLENGRLQATLTTR